MLENSEFRIQNSELVENEIFLQSAEWLEFLKSGGAEAEIVNFYEGQKILATGLLQKIPYFSGAYAECSMGPVFLEEASLAKREIDMVSVVEQARKIGVKAGVDFVRFIFNLPWSEELAQTLYEYGAVQPHVLKNSLPPQDTQVLLTNTSEENFLEQMHQKTRYNLKVSLRHRVIVREIKDQAPWFYPLLKATSARDHIAIFSEAHYKKLLARRQSDSFLRTHLYAAEVDGHIASAALCLGYGDTLTYLHGASDYNYRQLMTTYALHFGIWQKAKERGYGYYDLWGTNPSPKELKWRYKAKWEGISRFKMGFGGVEKNYLGAFDIPINKGKYRFLALLAKIRKII